MFPPPLMRASPVALMLSFLAFGFLWEESNLATLDPSPATAPSTPSTRRRPKHDHVTINDNDGDTAKRKQPQPQQEEEDKKATTNYHHHQEAFLQENIDDMFDYEYDDYNNSDPTDRDVDDDDSNDDPLIQHNENLIRPRPRNLRLVFVGDSITRYQYLSMAYWLRYGRWFDPPTIDTVSVSPNNLVHAHSFHHSFHPNEDWNEFFMQSNRMLYPYELCDCVRREDNFIAIERRYFWDPHRNNALVYINISGKSTLGHEGLFGRADPEKIFPFSSAPPTLPQQQQPHSFQAGLLRDEDQPYSAWEYFTWADLIQYHIGPLNLGPTAVAILNAGLHPNQFSDSLRAVALYTALDEIGMRGIWKTTTFTKEEVLSYSRAGSTRSVANISTTAANPLQQQQQQIPQQQQQPSQQAAANTDRAMCHILTDCWNISWTAHIQPELYYDQLHFGEPVYRILNEELLGTKKLDLLPRRYEPLDRSSVFSLKEEAAAAPEGEATVIRETRIRGSPPATTQSQRGEPWHK